MAKLLMVPKNSGVLGVAPAIALVNPKYAHNVGAVVRAASCFGFKQVWYTGNRIDEEVAARKRLPREERMKGYKDVELCGCDCFFDAFKNVTPVAIELRHNSECLSEFVHPENPLYVFGPEDGSIPGVMLRHCHRFVKIPTAHCVNLAAAVYIVMWDRLTKGLQNGTLTKPELKEDRGWCHDG